ncbi:MAG: YciI family protein [Burkholderiales bacterium]
MKYLLLVHHYEAAFGQMSETIRREMLAESVQVTHELHAAGQYIDASPLHPSAGGARVKVRDGKRFVTDGPFVETHEQVAGYFLVTAKDRDDAIDIAARIPGARLGYVDVRQVRDIDGLPEK